MENLYSASRPLIRIEQLAPPIAPGKVGQPNLGETGANPT